MTAISADIPSGLVDQLISLYCDWRTECTLVRDAYERLSSAAGCDRVLAYAAYEAALDREESAAHTYAAHIGLVTSMCP